MPSTDAATSTPVLPRAAARPAGPTGPERSAPPPNRVFADSGTSTPISNPVFLVSSPPGRSEAPRPVGMLTLGSPAPAPPPPPLLVGVVWQVTTVGSQE